MSQRAHDRIEDGAAGGPIPVRDVPREEARRLAELEAELGVERLVARLASRFLRMEPRGFADTLRDGLALVGEVFGVDRVQFFIVPRRADGVGGHHQWCAEGAPRNSSTVGAEEVREFRWSARLLMAGEALHLPDISLLPPEAAAERRRFVLDGVRSYLALPLVHQGRAVGFLDLARMRTQRGWSELEIARLRLVADVLDSAVRRIHAEEERRVGEERFTSLTQNARDTLVEMSLDGKLSFISSNFTRICGYSMERLMTLDPWSLVHPDDLPVLRRDAAAATGAGRSVQLTYRIRHADGSWRWLESTVSPFEAPDGERRLAIVIRDITERHEQHLELERALELEKRVVAFSRALIESGADQVDTGIDHGIAAAAALAGADRAYLITALGSASGGMVAYDWRAPDVPPRPHRFGVKDDRQRWIHEQLRLGRLIQAGRVEDLPDEAAGARTTLLSEGVRSFLCIPINADGQLIGVLGFHCIHRQRDWSAREITLLQLVADLFTSTLRRKRAEIGLQESQRRLLQAQKMEAVGTLAGGVAHDFNNQLTVMLANARYALAHVEAPDDVRQALGDLHRAAEHCAQLTRSLLAFSRRSPSEARSIEVSRVIGEARELLRPLIPSSIQLCVRDETRDARIVADPTQLQQVLVNLVVNARDAMPDGGRLDLTCTTRQLGAAEAAALGLPRAGGYAEIAVADTGAGIPEDLRPRIFEPFFTTKPVGQGTGLGLATAYGIVQQFGGVIGVDAGGRVGAVFRVLLPLAEAAADDAAHRIESGLRRGAGTVLLAEDEEGVRRLVARILREGGYEVIEAPDGAEALRLGRQHAAQVDALVTDVDMPRMGGIELARRLARQRPELPVLFISGTAADPIDLAADEAPAAHAKFLAKPFTEHALLESLFALLRS